MNKLFSEYNIKARIFPAILCSIPFLITKHFVIDPLLGTAFSNSIFSIVVGDISILVVLTYLFSQINRVLSKGMFENKSIFPTTKMLLPSGKGISSVLRQELKGKIFRDFNINLPDLAEENSDFENSLLRIKEIVGLIISKVGDGKLLLQHNIEYGFIRNFAGGSVVASVVSLINIILTKIFYNKTALILSIVLLVIYLLSILISKLILQRFSSDYAQILFREYLGNY